MLVKKAVGLIKCYQITTRPSQVEIMKAETLYQRCELNGRTSEQRSICSLTDFPKLSISQDLPDFHSGTKSEV